MTLKFWIKQGNTTYHDYLPMGSFLRDFLAEDGVTPKDVEEFCIDMMKDWVDRTHPDLKVADDVTCGYTAVRSHPYHDEMDQMWDYYNH
jgi:hypothetical protein